ncbi:putative F-box domain-containing protein [Medicago truncatula]|uniref:F-box protein interaction domain protein n=1 Tax=Medicago truncatula TaxID=3880 RepID=A0A072UAG9_MEDTR|nr:F-box/kelch-repeat protein At3g23880 [Medicago truncatula]KEH26647.1 F-box protein interaction domain protein [Medicago truncatula]RHN52179.1 putative F-box domain-containing protein [Medicago truncatula]
MAPGMEETLISPSPTLPFDLVAEILCRLPVKLLLQLRCLCKSFNSLISDPKFANKHLRLSTRRHRLMLMSTNDLGHLVLFNSLIPSDFSTSTVSYPDCLKIGKSGPYRVCSCNGILCFTMADGSAILWNPSIRTFKILPPLGMDKQLFLSLYSFGYNPSVNNYKIVAISGRFGKTKISVHTLGTDSWRTIQDFPYSRQLHRLGIFVSGTINWLVVDDGSSFFIVSLDLENESYKRLALPNLEDDCFTSLGVLRDCLCIITTGDVFLNVWIMKEYGNKESWTKLYSILHMQDRVIRLYTKALYIFEDEQLLIGFYELESYKLKLVVYNSKNGILKIPEIGNIRRCLQLDPEVYIESLISPCS